MSRVDRRCGLTAPQEVQDRWREELRARQERENAMECRRCTHLYSEHPWPQATACRVEGCACHCFWWPPDAA